jgi:rhodanese-related sulfurtransferase
VRNRFHTIRCAGIALSLGMLLTGCSSGGHDANSLYTERANENDVARGHNQSASGGDMASSPRPDELLGYRMGQEPLFDITLDQIRQHVRNNSAVFIDARGTRDFARGHVRGAINMPAGQQAAYMEQIKQSVAPDNFIIIYCSSSHCDSGEMLYEYLTSHGYSNMRVFKPGWEVLSKERDLR